MHRVWQLAVVCTVIAWSEVVLAQRRPIADDTLGNERSLVIPVDNIRGLPGDLIQGGAQRGNNLFHSFQEFNIEAERAVYFDDPGVQNILGRVTGGNGSDIQGRLGVLGDANLFLINPNGIVFGGGASLDVGGSFVATTADAIQFGNQGFFNVADPTAPPLLTVQPSAFLFNQIQSGTIENQSTVSMGADPLENELFGLRVPDGQNLVLLGGNVVLNNGGLNAYGGRVEIGSVAGTGAVSFNADGSLRFPADLARADVTFTNGSQVDVTLDTGGNIGITGRNIDVVGGSLLIAGIESDFGDTSSQAGDVTLNATDTIIVGEASRIENNVGTDAIGNAGNLQINAGSLVVTDGAQLSTTTFGAGNAGNISLDIDGALSMSGLDGNGNNSLIESAVGGTARGNGGNITIAAGSLFLRNGAHISNSTLGRGDARNISLDIDGTLSMSGLDGNGASSFIESAVGEGARGNGGNITITAGSLFLRDGAYIRNSTFGAGNAGNISLDIDGALSMSGLDGNGVSSLIESAVYENTLDRDGNIRRGGNITIETDSLILRDGASIRNSTFGRGNAGNIDITARDTLSMSGLDGDGEYSFIASAVGGTARGNGGNITITAGSLFLRDGAYINNSTSGRGNAGNINLDIAGTLSMSGLDGNGAGSFVESAVRSGAEGDGGNITIAAGSLFLRDGASIRNSTLGIGNAGNINLDIAGTLSMSGLDRDSENSSIGSVVDENTLDRNGNIRRGGNITIEADSLVLRDGASINNSTFGRGNAGNINLDIDGTLSMSGLDGNGEYSFIASAVDGAAEGNGGNITITAGSLFLTNGASLLVSSFGEGQAGDINVQARDINLDDAAQITAETEVTGRGGNITLQGADLLLLRNGSSISTTARTAQSGGDGGNITINADFIVAVPNENSDIRADAFAGNGGNINITTEGLFGIEPRDQPTELSDITTRSELGIQGNIEINRPDVDPSRGLTELPDDVVDASQQVAQTCPTDGDIAGELGSFFITGRGGVPANPADLLGGETVLGDLAVVEESVVSERRESVDDRTSITPSPSVEIVEAQGWSVNAEGKVVLTVETNGGELPSSAIAPVSCPSS